MIQRCIDCDKTFHVAGGDLRALCPDCAAKWIAEMEADLTHGDPNPLEELIRIKSNQCGKATLATYLRDQKKSPEDTPPSPLGDPAEVTPGSSDEDGDT